MPNIPVFRDWFEKRFGDLCELHDWDYQHTKCKLCADSRFVHAIKERGYPYLAILVWFAVQLPWVWMAYYKEKPH